MHTSDDIPSVCIIGSANVDLLIRTDKVPKAGETTSANEFSTGCGGKGANQAVATARISPWPIFVKMVGAVGDDIYGSQMRKNLGDNKINTSCLKTLSGVSTGVANVIVEEKTGENRILIVAGANGKVTGERSWLESQDRDIETDSSNISSPYGHVTLFQFELPLNTVYEHIKTASQEKSLIILNAAPAFPMPDDIYSLIDILIVNESEAFTLSNIEIPSIQHNGGSDESISTDVMKVAKYFTQKGVKSVIVTLGAYGAFIATCSEPTMAQDGEYYPALPAKVVDTTAAGDTFVGAVACFSAKAMAIGYSKAEFLGDEIMVQCMMKYALKASAKTIEKRGAQDSIPTSSELEGDEIAKSFMHHLSRNKSS